VTAIDALCMILDAGGRVVSGPERSRLLAPPAMRPLVDAHREQLRALLEAYGHCDADVFRRAQAFKQQIDKWTASGRWAVPVLVLPGSRETNVDRCISCGSSIEGGWRCATCLSAIDAAFDMSGSERG
jgi:alpha-beta hydrolase superfamily lysophospholipase